MSLKTFPRLKKFFFQSLGFRLGFRLREIRFFAGNFVSLAKNLARNQGATSPPVFCRKLCFLGKKPLKIFSQKIKNA